MKCQQLGVRTPVDFEGDHLNILIGVTGAVWVCIDEQSVVRVKNLKAVTITDDRAPSVKRAHTILARSGRYDPIPM